MEGYEILMKSDEKFAFLVSNDEVMMFRSFLKAKLEVMKNVRYNTYMMSTGTLYMNYMGQLVNEVFSQLIEAGILQHFTNRLFSLFPKHQEVNEPKIFSLDDLWFGFEIWLYSCAISASVFALEFSLYWTWFWTKEVFLKIFFIKELVRNRY
jgi:hypothetical protein